MKEGIKMVERIGSKQAATQNTKQSALQKTNQSANFDSVFKKELKKVRFSSHAAKRLDTRGIKLNHSKMMRLNEAVQLADKKGSKETLVLVDDVAMVVSVKNNTVITVVDRAQAKDNVFTNIDSAVLT